MILGIHDRPPMAYPLVLMHLAGMAMCDRRAYPPSWATSIINRLMDYRILTTTDTMTQRTRHSPKRKLTLTAKRQTPAEYHKRTHKNPAQRQSIVTLITPGVAQALAVWTGQLPVRLIQVSPDYGSAVGRSLLGSTCGSSSGSVDTFSCPFCRSLLTTSTLLS